MSAIKKPSSFEKVILTLAPDELLSQKGRTQHSTSDYKKENNAFSAVINVIRRKIYYVTFRAFH